MALYGPNAGVVPFTGFSPTLGVTDAIVPVTSGQVAFDGMNQEDFRLSRALMQGPNRVLRRLILTLLGVVAGSTATETHTKVQAIQALNSITTNGGLIPVETVNRINRATTAGDITNVTAALTRTFVPSSYVADASGNGGGGKGGF